MLRISATASIPGTLETEVEEIRKLAREVGYPEETLDLHLVRNFSTSDHETPNRPTVLLTSAGEGVVELLIKHWLGESAAEALYSAAPRPLEVGAPFESDVAATAHAPWPTHHHELPHHARVIAVAAGDLADQVPQTNASSASWGTCIFVTRASCPLTQRERSFLASLSDTVAVVRILVLAAPGELSSPADIDHVAAYAQRKAEIAGFEGVRFDGVTFWWINADNSHPLAIASPNDLLRTDRTTLVKSRELLLRNALIRILGEIRQCASADGARKPVQLDD